MEAVQRQTAGPLCSKLGLHMYFARLPCSWQHVAEIHNVRDHTADQYALKTVHCDIYPGLNCLKETMHMHHAS